MFEEGAYYPVKYNGEITIAHYWDDDSWEVIGNDDAFQTKDFDEIGEKIELNFPNQNKPLVEGKENKCGLNPPNTSHLRPPPPGGSRK